MSDQWQNVDPACVNQYIEAVQRELAYIASDPLNEISIHAPSAAYDKEYLLYTQATRINQEDTLLLLVLQDLRKTLGGLYKELESHQLTVSKYEADLKKAANGIEFLQFRTSYISKLEQWAKATVSGNDLTELIKVRNRLQGELQTLGQSTTQTDHPPQRPTSHQDNPTDSELILEIMLLRKQLDEVSKREAQRLYKEPKVRTHLCPQLLEVTSSDLFQAVNQWAPALFVFAIAPMSPAPWLAVPSVAGWFLTLIIRTGVNIWCNSTKSETTGRSASIRAYDPSQFQNNDSTILTTPQSLGILLKGDKMGFIIPRNTRISKSWTNFFTTTDDNQTGVLFVVLQGESVKASENKRLGEFQLHGLTPRPAGEVELEVTFDIDKNGFLNARAKEKNTDNQTSRQITSPNIVIKSRV